jgi:hypothetical protein
MAATVEGESTPGTYTIVRTPDFTVKLAAGITFTPQRMILHDIQRPLELDIP